MFDTHVLYNTFYRKLNRTPIWFMRQAGRHLPEFREIRSRQTDLMKLFLSPADIHEITLQPARRYDIDGAIIFSDILVIPYALGQDLQFSPGPKLPALDLKNIEEWCKKAVQVDIHEKLQPVYESLSMVRESLDPKKTLIGFAGAPWTLACYMIEGESSRTHLKTKTFAYQHPEKLQTLITLLEGAIVDFLERQVSSGAQVVQLFDSWAGILPQTSFMKWCVEPAARIVKAFKERCPDTPIICFPKGGQGYYESYVQTVKPDGLSLDSFIDDARVAAQLQSKVLLQGNLDPQLLVAGGPLLEAETLRILDTYRNGRHIFNLGHGVLPEVPVAHVEKVIETVRRWDAENLTAEVA